VLRHGFKFYGKTFKLAYFKPAHGLNEEMLALYALNVLTVTRQVPFHPGRHDTVDLLFAVNGVPVATCELKNPGTGQSWRHAVKRTSRIGTRARRCSPSDPRAGHFAADPDEVHMTTRVRKEATHFLPFNRGSHPGEVQCGRGPTPAQSGYRTGYLWRTCSSATASSTVLGHFMFIGRPMRRPMTPRRSRRITKEALIFPATTS